MANSSFFKNTGTTTQIQSSASASAAAALASEQAALASENAAAADLLLTNADVVLTNADVVTTAGNVTAALGHSNTASGHATAALGHANTASGHATTASGHSTTASGHATTASGHSTDASNAKDDASKLAITAEDSQYTLSDGVTQGYSALHYAAKADASVTLAVNAQTAAETALDDFTDQYLGSKNTSGGEPTTDNDGNTLVNGTLFWDDTNGIMKVWNGTSWVAAYASSGGALVAANNLSDLSDAGVSRTNLGLGTVAVLDTGTSALNAVQLDGSARLPAVDGSQLTGLPAGYTGWTVSDGTNSENIASTDTVAFSGSGATTVTYDTSTNTLTVSSTDTDTTYTAATTSAEGLMSAADKTKLDGVEASADVTDATNVTAAGALMTTGGSVTGDVSFGDNDKAIFGAGSDLAIYHSGTNSIIEETSGAGSLIIKGTNISFEDGTGAETYATFIKDNAVTLRYDNALKLATTATGVSVTGTVAATSYTGDGSSLTGISAGATGGGSDQIFYENGQTVTTNYTITNGKNAMSAGPITINTGVAVSVGTGETWTVV